MTDANEIMRCAELIVKAINHAGPRPDVHWEIMQRHRREWPTLWFALDRLIYEMEASRDCEG